MKRAISQISISKLTLRIDYGILAAVVKEPKPPSLERVLEIWNKILETALILKEVFGMEPEIL